MSMMMAIKPSSGRSQIGARTHRGLHHLGDTASTRLDDSLQVLERLLGLCLDAAFDLTSSHSLQVLRRNRG